LIKLRKREKQRFGVKDDEAVTVRFKDSLFGLRNYWNCDGYYCLGKCFAYFVGVLGVFTSSDYP
jgi:hypothetical protein